MRGQKLREREGRKNAVHECVAQMEELARLAYEARALSKCSKMRSPAWVIGPNTFLLCLAR
jgi:hypothetical protein